MRAVALTAVLCMGCASMRASHPMPSVPPAVDVDSLVPPPRPPLQVPAGVPTFPTRPVEPGQCRGLPAGILVSEPIYAQLLDSASERNRLRTETAALHKLRGDERAICLQVEDAFRRRVAELEQSLETAERGLLWKVGASLLVGVAFTLVTVALSRPAARP